MSPVRHLILAAVLAVRVKVDRVHNAQIQYDKVERLKALLGPERKTTVSLTFSKSSSLLSRNLSPSEAPVDAAAAVPPPIPANHDVAPADYSMLTEQLLLFGAELADDEAANALDHGVRRGL